LKEATSEHNLAMFSGLLMSVLISCERLAESHEPTAATIWGKERKKERQTDVSLPISVP